MITKTKVIFFSLVSVELIYLKSGKPQQLLETMLQFKMKDLKQIMFGKLFYVEILATSLWLNCSSYINSFNNT